MNNKYTIALYASVISSMLVASMFAISYVQQQAAAQGNQTSAGGALKNMTNSTGGKLKNMTSNAIGAIKGAIGGGK